MEITTITAKFRGDECVFHISPRLLASQLYTRCFLEDMCRKLNFIVEDTIFLLADGKTLDYKLLKSATAKVGQSV